MVSCSVVEVVSSALFSCAMEATFHASESLSHSVEMLSMASIICVIIVTKKVGKRVCDNLLSLFFDILFVKY
jgi:hypothetical protein